MDGLDVTQALRLQGEVATAGERVPPAVDGPSVRFGRNLAVIVGIDDYGEGIAPLRSAVSDAREIARVLARDHGFETLCLFDGEARLTALQALLRELPEALGPDDRLLFYFAGHGIALDGDAGPAGYLVPSDARRADPESFLPMQALHDALKDLVVRHAFVILDCCFAGTFRWSSLRDIEPDAAKLYHQRYDRYLESSARQVLTSASSDQLALDVLAGDRDEGAGDHSPFAIALLAGLAGAADYTLDNVITADELALYVRERVAPAAEAAGRRQVPQCFQLPGHDGGEFIFQVPNTTLALVPAPELDEASNPYRGLQAFREEDRTLFFGREAAAGRLTEAVRARPLTVVVGPSGCGKSSLVRAGLVPALRAEGWTVLPPQRPGHEPLAVLDAWTRALGAEVVPGDSVASWLAAVTAAARDRPCLAIVDQLEELVTHRTPADERAAFLGALASALEAAPRLRVVATVRSDAEPLLHDGALASRWGPARFAAPAMTRDELRQAIARPAVASVLHFEPAHLVERLIDDVALVPTPLPLLSFALSELYRRCWMRWQRGEQDRKLRQDDYEEMGSVARALTQRATAVHEMLEAEAPAYAITIRNVFTRMIAVAAGEVARRRVPLDELVYGDPAENQRVADVLQRFHEARLISLGTEAPGVGAYAEPTHDELVRGWTKVGQWLGEIDTTPGMRTLPALGDAARSWSAHRHDAAYLWNDPRVDLLSALNKARPFVFNAGEARFLEHCGGRRRRLRVRLIGGLAAAVAVLAVIGVIALSVVRAQEQELRRDVLRTNAYAAHALAGAAAFHLREQMDEAVALAADPAVRRFLRAPDHEALNRRRRETPYESFTLLDRAGTVISNVSYTGANNIGKSYAWRDYFVGARQLGEAGHREGYISSVIQSEEDGLQKFGIAAPIYDGTTWIGVLMVTVGTDFALAQKRLDHASEVGPIAVVVGPQDRSRYSMAGAGEYVVVLHEGLAHGAKVVIDSPRLRELRGARTKRKQLRWIDPAPITDDEHRDPLPGFGGRWLAGFAPVGDTGFVVIVQTRYDAAIAPNARLSRSFGRRAGSTLFGGLLLAGVLVAGLRLLRRRGEAAPSVPRAAQLVGSRGRRVPKAR